MPNSTVLRFAGMGSRSSRWVLALFAMSASSSALSAATFEEAFAVYDEGSAGTAHLPTESSEETHSQPEPKATNARLTGPTQKPSSSVRCWRQQSWAR